MKDLEIERKFLVESVDFSHPVLAVAHTIDIEQTYLFCLGSGGEARVRKSVTGQGTGYTLVHKQEASSSKTRIEKEYSIGRIGYWLSRILFRVRGTGTIKKTRYRFSWNDQVFELDWFKNPLGLMLLEIELDNEDENVDLPPFIVIDREVTDDPEYRNAEISKRI